MLQFFLVKCSSPKLSAKVIKTNRDEIDKEEVVTISSQTKQKVNR